MFVGFRAGSSDWEELVMAEQSRFIGVSDSDAEAGQEVCDEIVCRITCIKTSRRRVSIKDRWSWSSLRRNMKIQMPIQPTAPSGRKP